MLQNYCRRERSYSVPQVFDFIERHGLTFTRWQTQAPYLPQCGSFAGRPHASRVAALPLREQYAAMELWRGTISAHSLVIRGNDASNEHVTVRFDDERWPRCVPLRLPHTLCVRERLPPGAVAVLLNRSHPYTDLILPIDAHEMRIFDAIDGHHSIEDIVDQVDGGSASPRTRAFLEKLWWYDQVVFDVSKAR